MADTLIILRVQIGMKAKLERVTTISHSSLRLIIGKLHELVLQLHVCIDQATSSILVLYN